jgi:hypothetical protein
MSFTPWSQTVKDGFEALEMTPYWYQSMLVIMGGAIYGVRIWRRDNARKDLLDTLVQKKAGSE